MRPECELTLPARYCEGWAATPCALPAEGLRISLPPYPTASELLPLCNRLVRTVAPAVILGRCHLPADPSLCRLLCNQLCVQRWSLHAGARLSLVLAQRGHTDLVGFLRFRMGDLLRELDTALDQLIAQREIESQYLQHIKLLRTFSDFNRDRVPRLDVYFGKNSVRFGQKIGVPPATGPQAADVLISVLVNTSPSRIVLHHPALASPALLRTIRNVFPGRVICVD